MLKRLSSQEIFVVIAAIITLLFMYSTILLSASNEKIEENVSATYVEQDKLIDGDMSNEDLDVSSIVYAVSRDGDE